jgi:hypothetical protein
MDEDRSLDATFKVRQNHSDRAVACFVEMALGTSGPYAWEDDDEGAPFWRETEQKWELHNNNFWLRKVKEDPPDEESESRCLNFPVRTFKISGRYLVPLSWDWSQGDPPRLAALKALAKWLECDLMLG